MQLPTSRHVCAASHLRTVYRYSKVMLNAPRTANDKPAAPTIALDEDWVEAAERFRKSRDTVDRFLVLTCCPLACQAGQLKPKQEKIAETRTFVPVRICVGIMFGGLYMRNIWKK